MKVDRRAFLALPALHLATHEDAPPKVPVTKIIFGGDVILARRAAQQMASAGSPFRHIAERFRKADIAFVNLESPFSDQASLWPSDMIFRAVPDAVSVLSDAGIDVVSTANNHVRDCGERGIVFTLDWLARHGIAAVGTGIDGPSARAGVVLERNSQRFGFLAYTFDANNGNYLDSDPRVAMLDKKTVSADIAGLRRRADVVVVSMHAGIEYQRQPWQQQTEFAHAAIDAGAALVVGHHPHVVQTHELYKDGFILYSLGNLVFDQAPPETNKGLIAEATFVERRLVRCDLIPIDIADAAPRFSSRETAILRFD